MKKDPKISVVQLGDQTVKYVEGADIREYIPNEVLERLVTALKIQGYDWNDALIDRCKLVRNIGKVFKLMLDHEPIKFNGKMVFWFWEKNGDYKTVYPYQTTIEMGFSGPSLSS